MPGLFVEEGPVYRNRVETETDVLVGKREDLLRQAPSGRAWGPRRATLARLSP